MKAVAQFVADILFPHRPIERFARRLRKTHAIARRTEIVARMTLVMLLAAIYAVLLTR